MTAQVSRPPSSRPWGPPIEVTRLSPALVWQYDNSGPWERDWIHELLGDVCSHEIYDDRRYRSTYGFMYVVENEVTKTFHNYCLDAKARGCAIRLLHLGDEGLQHDLGVYACCAKIWRNHWSASFRLHNNIRFLPLGYKSGFARTTAPPASSARPYRWGFAGDPHKTTRQDMLAAMRTVADGREHLIAGWDAPDSLDVNSYRAFMESVVFAPCPRGFVSPDCFRVYEALEAGCIPIVERRGNGLDDYFTAALGDHPLPSLDRWSEAPALIAGIAQHNGISSLQAICLSWWASYKKDLKKKLSRDFSRA